VAYNPFREIRAPVAFIKNKLLGVRELKFYVPETDWQKLLWIIVHESSVFPAKGSGLLRKLAQTDGIEFHLVTARFHFLDKSLNRWLNRYRLKEVFTSINMNVHDRQPHIHKLETINRLGLDYFVEDNWDIVDYLQGKTETQVHWIYNITDRGKSYPHKHPYLEKALRKIASNHEPVISPVSPATLQAAVSKLKANG
jgi:hypothetical protein